VPSSWSGRKVGRLVALTLASKGTTCHICRLPGADSADHDPPRSVLLAMGMPNPDDPAYLFPAHRYPCNVRRKARAITDDLRQMMRDARLDWCRAQGIEVDDRSDHWTLPASQSSDHSSDSPSAPLSPRWARRRAIL
jgi:hypothetical protein